MALTAVAADTLYFPDLQQPWCLGKGGCCNTVERYYEKDSKRLFAIKKVSAENLSDYGDLLLNEAESLSVANDCKVTRVIEYVDTAECGDAACIVLELVQGETLRKDVSSTRLAYSVEAWEQQMLVVATQLLDTLELLHVRALICHLDITNTNVMMQAHSTYMWDSLRLIDFGFARSFDKGGDDSKVDVHNKDVVPSGATTAYAAPEVLRSIQYQLMGAGDDEEGVRINGPAADMWSFGCVCYEMLTGWLPFRSSHTPCDPIRIPSVVPEELVPTWGEYESMLDEHNCWINCRVRAKRDGGPIRHPLLARARLNSGNPDAAAEFFQLLFTIKPEERGLHELLDHPYMTATSDAMFRGLTPMYTPPNAHFCEGEESSDDDDEDDDDDDEQEEDDDSMSSDEESSDRSSQQLPDELSTCTTPLMPEDPCCLPKSGFAPTQQQPPKEAGTSGCPTGILGSAYYAAGAVYGIVWHLGLRKLWGSQSTTL